MKCYAVVDTNVLVSSLITKNNVSATVQVVKKIFTGEITPLFSGEILNEYSEVLHRPKFGLDKELLDTVLAAIEDAGILISPSQTGEILPDMKDLPFYEAVLECRDKSAYLVTGNIKHFPEKPFIVTPAQFLEVMTENK